MVLGVDSNPRFVLFSLIAGGILAYIFQNMGLLINFLVIPVIGWILLLIFFVLVFNVIYALAVYEIEENEYIKRIYIIVIIALILVALLTYGIGLTIFSYE